MYVGYHHGYVFCVVIVGGFTGVVVVGVLFFLLWGCSVGFLLVVVFVFKLVLYLFRAHWGRYKLVMLSFFSLVSNPGRGA